MSNKSNLLQLLTRIVIDVERARELVGDMDRDKQPGPIQAAAEDESPEFRIDGPGRYVTRKGEIVAISRRDDGEDSHVYPWQISGEDLPLNVFTDEGRFYSREGWGDRPDPRDIVSKAPTPAEDKPQESPKGLRVEKLWDSTSQPLDLEVEFYCSNCKSMRDTIRQDPDLVCAACAWIIASFRSQAENRPSGDNVERAIKNILRTVRIASDGYHDSTRWGEPTLEKGLCYWDLINQAERKAIAALQGQGEGGRHE